MIKSIILAVLLLVSLAYAQSCDTFQCVEEGAECTGDSYSNGGIFDFNPQTNNDNLALYCNTGFYCNQFLNIPTCAKLGAKGDLCPNNCYGENSQCQFANQGCEIGLVCFGDSEGPSTCQPLQYASIGEDCDTQLECLSGLLCDLEESVCVLNNTNFDDDQECDSGNEFDCGSSAYCSNTGKCLALSTEGQGCSTNSQCVANTICDEGICRPYFSRASGQSCSSDSACDISASLYCDGTCTSIGEPGNGNCSSVGCTGAASYCKCNSAGSADGTCTSTYFSKAGECKTSVIAFYNCIAENKCTSPYTGANVFAPDSCAMEQCSSEYCDAISNCQSSVVGSCNSDVLANGFCSGSNIITASIAMVFLALLVILL